MSVAVQPWSPPLPEGTCSPSFDVVSPSPRPCATTLESHLHASRCDKCERAFSVSTCPFEPIAFSNVHIYAALRNFMVDAFQRLCLQFAVFRKRG
jgi:hypothetical protein